jgi:hypothetical protein
MSLSKPASQPSRIISPHWHVLTNAPDAPATHWKQYALPLQHPRTVDAGTPVDVEFTCIPDDPGFCQHAWSIRVADAQWEHHDTRGLTY